MSVTVTELDRVPTSGDGDEGLDHYYCCDESRSMCGLDLSGVFVGEGADADEDMCVVCDDLADEPCDEPDCPYRSP